jgi:hypothetical protein
MSTLVRLSARRFEQSPYFDCYASPESVLGVAAGRYYESANGQDPLETYGKLRKEAVLYDVPEKPWQIEGPDAVEEGLDAVLETVKPGVLAGDVHRAWQTVLDRHGLVKESRIGYSIGVGYSPDWGEHTLSLRAGEETVIEQNMVVHVMLGMWLDDWGMEMSETVAVTQSGAECLTRFPRNVQVID